MDAEVRSLDLLFRRIPPEALYGRCLNELKSGVLYDEQTFLRYAESCFAGYSKEEKALLFHDLVSYCEGLEERYGYTHVPLSIGALLRFAKETVRERIVEDKKQPICLFESLERWREGSLLLGQDGPACLYLAHEDVQSARTRNDFGWPATIHTDHHSLNHVLKGGIADNHRHLKGSTQLAELSWCALMNHPMDYDKDLEQLDYLLQPVYSRGRADNVWSMTERVALAAMLRASLFSALQHPPGREAVWLRIETEYIQKLEPRKCATDFIDSLRVVYGKEVMAPDGSTSILDYALTRRVYEGCKGSPYRVLAGERSFLYQCFSATLIGRFDDADKKLFCLYLSLKSAFRGELIQVNREVGFHNFMLYQNRKSFSWGGTPYRWEAYRMAINGPLETQHVISLESRIGPEATAEENMRSVREYDLSTQFARVKDGDVASYLLSGASSETDAELARKYPDFFVVHFIKDDDENPPEKGRLELRCRHQAKREEVKGQSLALAEALRSSPYYCGRVRGIDACNMELNCRPEVFANAFRYLSNLYVGDYAGGLLQSQSMPHLARTYHVGEDFYSIADGVRAIDEAIVFLELRQGDRLGHALALGVDPEIHCRCKSNTAIMTKQNYLDNMVWLLYRATELGLDMPHGRYEQVRRRAEQTFKEIYGDVVYRNGWYITARDYYDSMLLRGDDPECYRSMRCVEPTPFEDAYRAYALRQNDERLSELRKDERIAGLYYLYHYGNEEKRKALKTVRVNTGANDYALMRDIQDAVIDLVDRMGLIIECNPSSNVLIGTFKEYDQHPMFRFNHGSMTWNRFETGRSRQLKVCINTDDLGVFDTSLYFEYALIRRTLESQYDEAGKRLFTTGEIDDYLCKVRDYGNAAVFGGSF